jgi:hypothetical protein
LIVSQLLESKLFFSLNNWMYKQTYTKPTHTPVRTLDQTYTTWGEIFLNLNTWMQWWSQQYGEPRWPPHLPTDKVHTGYYWVLLLATNGWERRQDPDLLGLWGLATYSYVMVSIGPNTAYHFIWPTQIRMQTNAGTQIIRRHHPLSPPSAFYALASRFFFISNRGPSPIFIPRTEIHKFDCLSILNSDNLFTPRH